MATPTGTVTGATPTGTTTGTTTGATPTGTTTGTTTGATTGATPTGTATGAAATGAGYWRIALADSAGQSSQFTAVTVSGSADAWAFELRSAGPGQVTARHFDGSSWQTVAFPGRPGERVTAAASSAPTDVWAFTSNNRALHFDGSTWVVSTTFPAPVGSALALSRSDVWVFGTQFMPGSGLGAWHYDGTSWSKVAGGQDMLGGSAISASDIWTYSSDGVAHWTGGAWTRTSLAGVLPPGSQLCAPHLTGIAAVSGSDVWAIGTGGCQDEGGPFALLHFDGRRWTRVLLDHKLGDPIAIISDGHGGWWIPEIQGAPGATGIEHYRQGALTASALPVDSKDLLILASAGNPGGSMILAAGASRAANGGAILLGYQK